MDYNMMPPPHNSPSSTVSFGSSHMAESLQNSIYSDSSLQPCQTGVVTTSGNASVYNTHYKPHFSGRAHVNRPPPLSLNQTLFRDTISQSVTQHYHDHQSPAHLVHSPQLTASPHPVQSPLIAQSPHIDQTPHTAGPMLLHRQQSGQHVVHSPLHQSFQTSGAADITQSPRSTPGHLQQNVFSDPNPSTLPNTPYEQISSPLRIKHRHYSDSTTRSPHPYNPAPLHHFNNPMPSPHHYTDPSNTAPSAHYFTDASPSPRRFAESTQPAHHFNDPNSSSRHFQEANNAHRTAYLESSQPGTPVGYVNSHPGTPAGYVNSPHHASPHPNRSSTHQHFFGPNVMIPSTTNGSIRVEPGAGCDVSSNAHFNQTPNENTTQHQNSSSVLLHSNAGGHGDAMLSAINISHSEHDSVLQDSTSSLVDSAMETDWHSPISQSVIKQAANNTAVSNNNSVTNYGLFDSSSSPADVEELLSQATAADFVTHTGNLSLSDVTGAKDAPKVVKSRSKGRPAKTSPRSYGAQCPVCSKTFNNSSALAKHKLTHSDERKYVCNLCSKAFKRQDHLNGHMMTHRTKKPFECTFDGCTKSYCDARSLRRHLENHHNVPTESLYDMTLPNYGLNNGGGIYPSGGFSGDPTSPSPHASPSYQAGQGQSFRFDTGNESSDGANYYMSSESNHAPAKCTVCHKRFKNLPALNGHMRLHGGYASTKKLPPAMESVRPSEVKSHKSDSHSSSDVKFNMSDRSIENDHSSSGRERDASHSSSTTCASQPLDNVNFQSSQGNVRQDGGRLAGSTSSTCNPAVFSQSSSEPPTQPMNTMFSYPPYADVLLLEQMRKQTLVPPVSRQGFPIISQAGLLQTQTIHSNTLRSNNSMEQRFLDRPAVPEHIGQSIYHVYDIKSELCNGSKLGNIGSHAKADHGDDRENDKEVSEINSFKLSNDRENFLAERKRHASAPDKLLKSWDSFAVDQQQQLNERIAQAQNDTSSHHPRRRRSSADNHHHREFKHPYSSHSGDALAQSDGAMLFRSPPPGGLKRKKNRPEPLVIPPNVAAIQSRLRSPRIWEPVDYQGPRHTGKTPPPYTPPPILSPMRSGTGLFHVICRPAQGPLSASTPANKMTFPSKQPGLAPPAAAPDRPVKMEPMSEEPEELVVKEEPAPSDTQNSSDVVSDVVLPTPIETDVQPHINIGPNHQVTLPPCRKSNKEALRTTEKATLLWSPDCLSSTAISSQEYAYMDFSCSAAVPGSGSNKEYALHQLFYNKGDLLKSLVALMSKSVSSDFMKYIRDYHYQDSDIWTTEDIEVFTEAIMKADKDFNAITAMFNGRKKHKECIEFYYLWKKICPDEYKRLRIVRRKRKTDDELYNLRSRADKSEALGNSDDDEDEDQSEDESASQISEGEADDEEINSDAQSSVTTSVILSAPQPTQQHSAATYTCDYPDCQAVFHSKQALNGHVRMHVPQRSLPPSLPEQYRESSPASVAPSTAKKVKAEPIPPGTEEFPCKLCGKVFYKVKSRSAHMKSHSVLAKKQREAAAQARANQ